MAQRASLVAIAAASSPVVAGRMVPLRRRRGANTVDAENCGGVKRRERDLLPLRPETRKVRAGSGTTPRKIGPDPDCSSSAAAAQGSLKCATTSREVVRYHT